MNERVLQTLEFEKIRAQVEGACSTPYGRERAARLEPLTAHDRVLAALGLTEEGVAVYRQRGVPPFPRGRDIRESVRRAARGGTMSAAELLAVAEFARQSRAVRNAVERVGERAAVPVLAGLAQGMSTGPGLDGAVLHCIGEDGEVLDRASEGLQSVRRGIRSVRERMKRLLEEMVRSQGLANYLQDAIVTLRGDHYCLAVKSEHQNRVPGVVHDESASGSTVFIEPQRVLQMGNELRRLRSDEEKEVERVLQSLSSQVAAVSEELLQAAESLGEIDFAVAKAEYARRIRAVRPLVPDEPRVRIAKGRHPLLDPDRCVPVDVRVGGDFHVLVITGPNTGGKTVTLKALGLFVVMAMSGLFVPAEHGAEIGFFQEVYADIGDEQSIEQNLSTFSSHMRNVVQILRKAERTTLALFDELGAGTDPTEGAALAVAILDELRTRGVFTAATTHYSELKAYALTQSSVMNASMEFDPETLAPTFRLLLGVPGQSNAFAIAARLGLDPEVIRSARSRLSEQETRLQDLIQKMEQNVADAERDRRIAEDAREEAERLAGEWQSRLKALEADEERRRRRAEEDARSLVRRAVREAQEILRDLREHREEGSRFKDHELLAVRKRLEGLAPESPLYAASGPAPDTPLAPGDEVRVLPLGGQKGTVLEVSGEGLTVAVGTMRLKVRRGEAELSRRGPAAAGDPAVPPQLTRTTDPARPEIDVRGRSVEEAVAEIDRYLDRAVLSGYRQVTLIHGKGTGALRDGLRDYLRRHPRVKSARPGFEGEGDGGVTVAELR